jgi:hypothetical protein
MAVGILTTGEQWGLEHAGEPRPLPKEDIQLSRLSGKRHFDAHFIKRDEVKQFRDDQRCIKMWSTVCRVEAQTVLERKDSYVSDSRLRWLT